MADLENSGRQQIRDFVQHRLLARPLGVSSE
jgi:hypothetical protein